MLVEYEAPDPVAVFGACCQHVLRFDAFEAHAVLAVAEGVTDLRMLVLGQYSVGTVHVEAEQVLDPVVGVGAAARGGTHLRDPGPDGRRRGINRDRAGRNAVRVFEGLVPR